MRSSIVQVMTLVGALTLSSVLAADAQTRRPFTPTNGQLLKARVQDGWQRLIHRCGTGLPTWKKAVIAGTTAIVIGTGIAGYNGHQTNQLWMNSGGEYVQLVDQAYLDGNAAKLGQIVRDAQGAAGELSVRLQKGKSGKLETQVVFARAAADYAALKHNEATPDPAVRVGRVQPAAWTVRLEGSEQQAQSQGNEGPVALALRDLRGEIQQQTQHAAGYETNLNAFGKAAPRLFGGNARGSVKKADQALGSFKHEVSQEQGLLAAKTAAMHGRVRVRLAQASSEFKGHSERQVRLASLDREVGAAVELAGAIQKNFDAIKSNRARESAMLAMAAVKSAVPVTKTRTVGYGDNQRTETYVDPEDHSLPYRLMAASAASAASHSEAEARERLTRLDGSIQKLQASPIVASEQLGSHLPAGANPAAVRGRHGPATSMFLPSFALIGNLMSSSVAKAEAQFEPVHGSLVKTAGIVTARNQEESGWIQVRIDQRVEQDVAQHLARQ